MTLVHGSESPSHAGSLRNALAPIFNGRIFIACAWPDTPFCLDDPIHVTVVGLLHRHPIRMVKTNRATRLQIIDAEHGRRISLLRGAQGGKAKYIRRIV